MVSREAVLFLCFHNIRFKVRQKRGAGGLPYFCRSASILAFSAAMSASRSACSSFTFFDIVVNIQIHQVLRLFAFFIAHTESGSPSLYTLQLILKHVATAIALDDEQDFPPLHLIEILMSVAPNLAYDYFEGLVGVLAFFRLPFPSRSSISGLMVDGTCIHSLRICKIVVTRFCTSSQLA